MLYAAGKGVKADNNEALYWLRQAATRGNTQTRSNLGNAFHMGREIPQDTFKAYAWLSIVDFLNDVQSLAKRPLKYAMIAPDSTSH